MPSGLQASRRQLAARYQELQQLRLEVEVAELDHQLSLLQQLRQTRASLLSRPSQAYSPSRPSKTLQRLSSFSP